MYELSMYQYKSQAYPSPAIELQLILDIHLKLIMTTDNNTLLIEPVKMEEKLSEVLQKYGFQEKKAGKCAAIFTNSSVDGIYTHGINRFNRFIDYLRKGYIMP